MRKVIISTETTSDLSADYIKQNNISVIEMLYTLDGVDYGGDTGLSLNGKEFFDGMRADKKTNTTMVSPLIAEQYLSKLAVDSDVVHLAFSSALSGTADSFKVASENINAKGGHKVYVVDTKAASLGEGLFVHLVAKYADTSKSAKEVFVYAMSIVERINQYFVVDDLNYLYRGGRVSKTTAVVGTLLKIKPVLHVDAQGRLIKLKTVITRRKSLQALVEKLVERYDKEYSSIFLSHGDCLEDAQYVADAIKEKTGVEVELINSLGPVIGSHSGPGTVALFFTGTNKDE